MRPLFSEIEQIDPVQRYGRVTTVQGLMLEVAGAASALGVGARVSVQGRGGREVPCEVTGFRDGRALCMPFESLEGVRMGCRANVGGLDSIVHPSAAWLGRVINAFGQPVDGKGPLPNGIDPFPLRGHPPPAHKRARVGEKLDLGVRALNTFTACCRGQRMGIFAGSGVGKSVLLSMLARYTACDVAVIGLIGERGREVQEFLSQELGPEGLARSIVIVATSDESPLRRRQAAYLTLAVAEYFRDHQAQVLCLIDSVTRFAMAQREIGLSSGEPPAAKGYTPTVFAELPRLLERAGPGLAGSGSITGLFTVLVEGDDHNEPIADAVRGILDGHIVLERSIAERGRFPAVNVLRSISRTMPGCNSPEEQKLVMRARRHMAVYEDVAELVRLGAYRRGADAGIDAAIHYQPALEAFLRQDKTEHCGFGEGFAALQAILADGPDGSEMP